MATATSTTTRTLSIPQNVLSDILSLHRFADTESHRYGLHSVRIESEGHNLTAVATDGRIMVWREYERYGIPETEHHEGAYLIPRDIAKTGVYSSTKRATISVDSHETETDGIGDYTLSYVGGDRKQRVKNWRYDARFPRWRSIADVCNDRRAAAEIIGSAEKVRELFSPNEGLTFSVSEGAAVSSFHRRYHSSGLELIGEIDGIGLNPELIGRFLEFCPDKSTVSVKIFDSISPLRLQCGDCHCVLMPLSEVR